MRWWLLKHVAAWCGLPGGLYARRSPDDVIVLAAFVRVEDRCATAILHRFLTAAADVQRDDPRVHSEWTH